LGTNRVEYLELFNVSPKTAVAILMMAKTQDQEYDTTVQFLQKKPVHRTSVDFRAHEHEGYMYQNNINFLVCLKLSQIKTVVYLTSVELDIPEMEMSSPDFRTSLDPHS
jgi:hypothetical protein